MNRGIALLVAVAVVVGLAGVAAAGPVGTVVAQDDAGTDDEAPESNETTDISPGERLSGVIGVQNAEVGGEVESRAFEVGLDRAETPEERADLVAQRLDRGEQRLAEIEQRQRELRERRDAGELSQGAYAARMAETAARADTVWRDANRSAVVAEEIPEAVRAERDLDDERLGSLRERASELSGPEVAAIARGVAGTDVGGPIAADRRGPPGDVPANESDRPGEGDGPPGGVGGPSADRGGNASGGPSDADAPNASADAPNASADAPGDTPSADPPGGDDTAGNGDSVGADTPGSDDAESTADGDAANGTDRGANDVTGPVDNTTEPASNATEPASNATEPASNATDSDRRGDARAPVT